MIQDVLLLVFCTVLAIAGLATVVWGVASGAFFSIDGLWLALISLTISMVFGGNVAWSLYTGEFQRILREYRQSASPSQNLEKTGTDSR